jgi:hypothetical protein
MHVVLADVYAEVETAIRAALASRTITNVLDATLAERPLPTTPADQPPDPDSVETHAP